MDGDFQVGDALEDAAADPLAGDLGEEAFDEIEPRRRGGREMQTEPRMQRQPLLDVRMFVGGVVVHDYVQIKVFRRPFVNDAEEPDELMVPMPLHTMADNRAVGHLERRE